MSNETEAVAKELECLQQAAAILQPLKREQRERVLTYLHQVLLKEEPSKPAPKRAVQHEEPEPEEEQETMRPISSKEYMRQYKSKL
jgi:hypothetical protein